MFREYDYEKTPVVDIVNDMILDANEKTASDIHFDPSADTLNVRIRIDGELVEYAKVPASVKRNLTTRIKIISGMNITESRLPQDGAIKKVKNTIIDLRVSCLHTLVGEKIVIRILDTTTSSKGLDKLGFLPENLEKDNKMVGLPNGIILLTGATGSGKSTTVYSMLGRLNTVDRNIITVEDPVEMRVPGINQVQVQSEIGLTFANVLRSILRQDPDVIMIGEIRDDETARIAVRAAITGHLVVSTIHTNNSLNTIERLLDMDIERYLLGSALSGIVSQRLVKRLCPECKQLLPTSEYEKSIFKAGLGIDLDQIYKPNPLGCPKCLKGYHGRMPLHEVLSLNQDIRDAIVNNMKKEDLRDLAYNKSGVITFLEDGLMKVKNGDTSFEEILRVIDVDDDIGESNASLKSAIFGKNSGDTAKTNVAGKLDVNAKIDTAEATEVGKKEQPVATPAPAKEEPVPETTAVAAQETNQNTSTPAASETVDVSQGENEINIGNNLDSMLQSALNTIGSDGSQQPAQVEAAQAEVTPAEAPVMPEAAPEAAPVTQAPAQPAAPAPSVETTTAPYQEVVQPQEVQYIVPEDGTQPTVKETIVELDGPSEGYYDNGYAQNMGIEPIMVSDIPQQVVYDNNGQPVAYDNGQYVNNQAVVQGNNGMLDQQGINMMLNNF